MVYKIAHLFLEVGFKPTFITRYLHLNTTINCGANLMFNMLRLNQMTLGLGVSIKKGKNK